MKTSARRLGPRRGGEGAFRSEVEEEMTIPLLDLKREYAAIQEELQAAWSATLTTMHLLKGENVAAFEREVGEYIGSRCAVGVASGTDALLLGVLGLGIGICDEVIIHANA